MRACNGESSTTVPVAQKGMYMWTCDLHTTNWSGKARSRPSHSTCRGTGFFRPTL